MVVPTLFFVMAYTYPLAVNFLPSYRIPADMIGQDEDEGGDRGEEVMEARKGDEESESENEKRV